MGHLKENSKGGVFAGFNLFGGVPDTDTETLALAAKSALPSLALRFVYAGSAWNRLHVALGGWLAHDRPE